MLLYNVIGSDYPVTELYLSCIMVLLSTSVIPLDKFINELLHVDIAVTSLKTQRRMTKINFLISHVKLAGDLAKDFLSTSSSIIHIARCLVSGAKTAFCRDVTRFAAPLLVAFFPIAHLGGCRKERQLIVSFLNSPDEKRALLLCALVV